MSRPELDPAPLFGALTPFTLRWGLRAIALVYVLMIAASFLDLGQPAHRTPFGMPLGGDYLPIRTGAELLERAYDTDLFHQRLREEDAGRVLELTWQYPPTYFLFIAWIAALPYAAGYALWGGANYAAYAAAVPAASPPGWRLALLSAPPAFACLTAGQNGLAVAALLFAVAALPERRPVLAGVAAGLLTVKPHFGLLIPLLWIIGGHWRSIRVASGTAFSLALLSVIIFGVEPWISFISRLMETGADVGEGYYPYDKMITALSAARLLGAPPGVAFAAQGLAALFALATAAIVWGRKAPVETRGAVLMLGALIAAPYGYVYDLPVAVFGTALIALRALRTEPLKYEWESLAALWAFSMALPGLPAATDLPFGFGAVAAAYAIALRRAAADIGAPIIDLKFTRLRQRRSGLPA